MKIKIKKSEIKEMIKAQTVDFPKYSTQLINLANQNAKGTVPKVVGQMSELIKEFDGYTIEEWEKWYSNKMPNAIDEAVDRIYKMVEKLKIAIQKIDEKLVEKWVRDLLITKTFVGLKFQEVILKKIAQIKMQKYRLAKPNEEAKGIDGFIGEIPVSIKPITYKTKAALNENIDVTIIYYDKKNDGNLIEYDF